jgi:uncharacterized protein
MGMQAIIDDWKANAERHSDRNFEFLHSLKMKSDRGVDQEAHQLHDEAFSIIDCTQCANCCKTISPLFRKSDVRRISERLNTTPADFKAAYLQADEDGDLFLKSVPCPFLGGDNRCTIYDVRPRDCVEYPHTQKKGLSHRTYGVAGNTVFCPAVFYIVEQMRMRRRWRER